MLASGSRLATFLLDLGFATGERNVTRNTLGDEDREAEQAVETGRVAGVKSTRVEKVVGEEKGGTRRVVRVLRG